MSEEKEYNCEFLQGSKVWCSKIAELEQKFQTAKEENERLKEDKITKADLRRELNYQCSVVENLKEEFEQERDMLCEQIEIWKSNCDVWMEQINPLTKQNKQMREALEKIVNDCTNKAMKCNICSLKKEPCTSYIAKQALKGVTKTKEIERKVLKTIYEMGVESLDPESFEQLENILDMLSKNRHVPEFKGGK